MQFYKYEGYITDPEWIEKGYDRRTERNRSRDISVRSTSFNQGISNKVYYYVSEISEDIVSIGIICDDYSFPDNQIKEYLRAIKIELCDASLNEITLNSARNMIRNAERNCFIDDEEEVFELFELDKLFDRFGRRVDYYEKIVDRTNKKNIYREAEQILSSGSLIPELDRIYSGKLQVKATGHPVHYFVRVDEEVTRERIYRLLQEFGGFGDLLNMRGTKQHC